MGAIGGKLVHYNGKKRKFSVMGGPKCQIWDDNQRVKQLTSGINSSAVTDAG